MDGQQQFLKPAQHVPFYVKRPITIDTSSHPHLFGYDHGGGKPASYSVDLSHSRFSRPKHIDQLSEPYNRAQSKSLRDVFEKAILRGEVAIHSPDEDNGVMRNPSFITASLPRPDKHKQKSATIGGDNYVHIGKNHHRSTDYFVDSSSESESETGRNNDAYLDDASSTISDELFKSTSEGQGENHEEDFNVQPLPQLLDIESHQAGRSTLGGLFKPKYRDYPRNNVHRTSERQHKEVIDSGTNNKHRRNSLQHRGNPLLGGGNSSPHKGNSLHRDESLHKDGALLLYNGRLDPNKDAGKLPRTKFPNKTSQGDSMEPWILRRDPKLTGRQSRDGSHSPEMSHNKYLPKKRKPSRPHSPRLSSRKDTAFNELDDIIPASPEIPRRHPRSSRANQQQPGEGRVTAGGDPLEQMEVEDPPWIKAELREIRRRKRRKIAIVVVVLSLFLLVAGLGVGIYFGLFKDMENTSSDVATTTVIESLPTSPGTIININTTPATPATQNITLTFDGSMRITNEDFKPAFENLTSPESVNLTKRFCHTMDNVFTANTTQEFLYQGCTVKNFTNGSVVIDFQLKFYVIGGGLDSSDLVAMVNDSGNFCGKDEGCAFEHSGMQLNKTIVEIVSSTTTPAPTTTTATTPVLTPTATTTIAPATPTSTVTASPGTSSSIQTTPTTVPTTTTPTTTSTTISTTTATPTSTTTPTTPPTATSTTLPITTSTTTPTTSPTTTSTPPTTTPSTTPTATSTTLPITISTTPPTTTSTTSPTTTPTTTPTTPPTTTPTTTSTPTSTTIPISTLTTATATTSKSTSTSKTSPTTTQVAKTTATAATIPTATPTIPTPVLTTIITENTSPNTAALTPTLTPASITMLMNTTTSHPTKKPPNCKGRNGKRKCRTTVYPMTTVTGKSVNSVMTLNPSLTYLTRSSSYITSPNTPAPGKHWPITSNFDSDNVDDR